MTLLLLSLAAVANGDVNCNGVPASEEPLVSFTDRDKERFFTGDMMAKVRHEPSIPFMAQREGRGPR